MACEWWLWWLQWDDDDYKFVWILMNETICEVYKFLAGLIFKNTRRNVKIYYPRSENVKSVLPEYQYIQMIHPNR